MICLTGQKKEWIFLSLELSSEAINSGRRGCYVYSYFSLGGFHRSRSETPQRFPSLRVWFHHQKPIDRSIGPKPPHETGLIFAQDSTLCIGLHVRQLPLRATRERYHYQHDIHARAPSHRFRGINARVGSGIFALHHCRQNVYSSNPLTVSRHSTHKAQSRSFISFPLCFYRK